METNVCGREKKIRGGLGILFLIVALVVGQTIGWIIGIIGGILLLTAVFSYCPVNAMAHRNSCSTVDTSNEKSF